MPLDNRNLLPASVLKTPATIRRFARIPAAALLLMFGLPSLAPAQRHPIPEHIQFNRDVRPILSNTCFKCHGADTAALEAGLRLDLPEAAYAPRESRGGESITPIVPGDPAQSEIWKRITADDPVMVMPPPDNLHQLTDRDKEVIRRWIDQGAEYQKHWAYIAPVGHEPPRVRKADWVSTPVDAFILRKLEDSGIAPAPEADRRTLIRRLSLDLTGLPPAPEEVEAFVTDERPGAYRRLVDRLLDSPHFGERMAVPWLDVVRFSDTVGFHGDQGQTIFPYRDYVIRAFNENKPFDQFLTEQVAGDLLPDPTPEQRVATGFNRLNMMTREGGAQPKEYLAKYAADRVRAIGTAFMGSTLACAECHDHKYDPFTAKDFYAMAAFFADIKQWGVYSDYDYTPNEELAGWSNNHPFPPVLAVKSDYLVRRQARLEREWAAVLPQWAAAVQESAEARQAFIDWSHRLAAFLDTHPDGWEAVTPVDFEVEPHSAFKDEADAPVTEVTLQPDGLVSITGDEIADSRWKRGTLTFTLDPELREIGTFQIRFVPDPANNGRTTRNPHAYFEADIRWHVQGPEDEDPRQLEMVAATASGETNRFFNGHPDPTEPVFIQSHEKFERREFRLHYYPEQSVRLAPGEQVVLEIRSRDIGSIRLAVSPLGLADPRADGPPADLSRRLAEEFVKTGLPLDADLNDRRFYYLEEILRCNDGYALSMVTESVEPPQTRVLPRGNWQDDSGDVVRPAPPEFLAEAMAGAGTGDRRLTRLDLAECMTRPDNPLTARTFVNRLWKLYFGTALSAVTDDLGSQGEWPSHPELLDWLAVEFVDNGWDVKHMVRQIVLSSTYRQSARIRPELMEADPNNRLLARQNPRRLEAEFIRDNALRIAGLLEDDIGGPSIKPYQPEGLYAHLNFPKREYVPHQDERQYRRGLYMHWQRTFLHPMLANFDAPGREECTADRTESNTPQQALTLLNDPTFVEAARVFAQNVLLETTESDGEARIVHMFEKALARPPSPPELDSLLRFLEARQAYYADNEDAALALADAGLYPRPDAIDPGAHASWTAVARVILNLHETLVRY